MVLSAGHQLRAVLCCARGRGQAELRVSLVLSSRTGLFQVRGFGAFVGRKLRCMIALRWRGVPHEVYTAAQHASASAETLRLRP